MNNLKLRHQASGVLLAGCLLVSAAHAQNLPAIQAVDAAPEVNPAAEVAPVPKRVAPPLAARQGTLELSFRDTPVKEVLNILGSQFGINLLINSDVDGVIDVNLTNQTAEEALQAVVQVAGNLSISRMANGTYIVRKKLPGEATNAVPQTSFAPSMGAGVNGFSQSITPTAGFGDGFGGTAINNAVGSAGSALPPLGQSPAFAQLPELVDVRQNSGSSGQRAIKLKNVKPSVMAYWLDPAHNPIPQNLQISRSNETQYGDVPVAKQATDGGGILDSSDGFGTGTSSNFASPYVNPYLRNAASSQVTPIVRANSQFGGGNNGGGGRGGAAGGAGGGQSGAGSFDLPGDIQQLVSVDPQNVLLVAGGTEEDIRRLQELIDVLDQPLRQVEIEAQFIDLQTQDATAFGIDFSTSRGNVDASTTGLASAPVQGSFQVGFARGNFQARLNALIADNRAKLITAPRVTAINNLTATLVSTERRPLILTSVSQNIGGQQAQNQRLIFVSTTVGLTVTPTINGDDTITVALQPEVSNQDGSTGLGNITQRRLLTIANVRDGDTIVLGGLKRLTTSRQNFKVPLLGDIPLIGGLFRSKTVSDTESELIIFLTAKIVRRVGDDVAVPGT